MKLVGKRIKTNMESETYVHESFPYLLSEIYSQSETFVYTNLSVLPDIHSQSETFVYTNLYVLSRHLQPIRDLCLHQPLRTVPTFTANQRPWFTQTFPCRT